MTLKKRSGLSSEKSVNRVPAASASPNSTGRMEGTSRECRQRPVGINTRFRVLTCFYSRPRGVGVKRELLAEIAVFAGSRCPDNNVIEQLRLEDSAGFKNSPSQPQISFRRGGITSYAAGGISGDPSPSEADLRMARRIVEASKILQLQLIDHVIVGSPAPGKSSYFSFKEGGVIS